MNSLVVATSFRVQLSKLCTNQPPSLLLYGDIGVGLLSIARHIADENALILQPTTAKGDVDSVNGSIKVDQIRQIYEQTRSGAVANIIIDDADRMTEASQNSLLKLLEEPTKNLHFILTTHHKSHLLDTILSRTTNVHVPNIDLTQSKELLLSGSLTATQQQQILFLASGRAKMIQLFSQHPDLLEKQATVVTDARELLSSRDQYDRLRIAASYSDSRPQALSLIDSALKIIQFSMFDNPSSELGEKADRLIQTYQNIQKNANPRLQLTNFVLQ